MKDQGNENSSIKILFEKVITRCYVTTKKHSFEEVFSGMFYADVDGKEEKNCVASAEAVVKTEAFTR